MNRLDLARMMRNKMKALLLRDYKNLELVDAPVPQIGPDEVLVRVAACAICGSDVHGYDGSTGRRVPPVIMGHEAAGTVAAVGQNVTCVHVGARVTFDSTVYCGHCFYCRRGEVNLCDARQVLGVSCAEYRRDGALAEYVAVPQHCIYPLPDSLSFEHAALIEPTAIALHAVNRATIEPGETAVVVGAGVIGLLAIQALKCATAVSAVDSASTAQRAVAHDSTAAAAAECPRVAAVDVDQSRLELAKRLGAELTLNPKTCEVPAEIKTWTQGRGTDVALEAVGHTGPVGLAVSCLRKGGRLVLIGNVAPTVELPLQQVVTRELTLLGSCASRGEYPQAIQLSAEGRVDLASMISAVARLEEGPSWFDRLYNREPGLVKVVLRP